MAVLWDIVGKASNLVQLLGLEAFTLVTIAVSFLRLRELRKEFWMVEERTRLLLVLLHCSPAGWLIMMQQHLELRDMVTSSLRDAHDLVASYNESTLLLRIRRGRSMARQFQDMCSRTDYYCGLILTINACLLIVQANHVRASLATGAEVNDGDAAPPTRHSTLDAELSSAAVRHGTHIINMMSQD